MKTYYTLAAVLAAFTSGATFAAQPEAAAPMTMPMSDHSAHHSGQMHEMMGKADRAKTPAERNKLMAENMMMMKAHMAEMSTMMKKKPMAMPDSGPMSGGMKMDAAHMAKMEKHMAMVHQMMESLMVQQQLMMKSGK